MDLVSILKDNGAALARFARKQLMVWLAVLSNPLAVISKINLRSTEAVLPALSFVVFVYAATLLVAFPNMLLYEHVAVSNRYVDLADFVLTALSFCLVRHRPAADPPWMKLLALRRLGILCRRRQRGRIFLGAEEPVS